VKELMKNFCLLTIASGYKIFEGTMIYLRVFNGGGFMNGWKCNNLSESKRLDQQELKSKGASSKIVPLQSHHL